jgi:hypothetical protein
VPLGRFVGPAVAAVLLGAMDCGLFPDLGDLSGTTPDASPGEAGPGDAAGDAAPSGDAAATGYRAVVLSDGPIAYYRLGDSVAPTAKDETGQHDGVYKGGVTLGVPGAIAGDPDTAASFDGIDDLLEVLPSDAFSFDGKAPFSVEAWVRHDSTNAEGIIGKDTYDAGPGYQGWFLVYNVNDRFQFYRGAEIVDISRPTEGQFFHVVTTFDGYTLLLYVDGVQAASDTNVVDVPVTGAPLWIGQTYYWGRFTGVLDEVAFYDKPLPPARVLAHYQAGTGK